jgi:beta-galactosidase
LIPRGHILAYEQIELQKGRFLTKSGSADTSIESSKTDTNLVVSNTNFKIEFDTKTGVLKTIDYGSGNILKEGITPNFWRATTDNDFGFKMPKKLEAWKKATKTQDLLEFKETVTNKEVVVNVNYNLPDAQDAKVELTYTITSDGSIEVETKLKNVNSELPILPRFGTNFIINNEFDTVKWLGRGPHENYQDRKTSALVGQYESEVSDLYVPYIRPQENGYKTDTRWLMFLNEKGLGIKITAPNYFSFSAHHQFNDDFDAGDTKQQRHTIDIKTRDFVNINIDMMQMGVGGDNSWGAMPHKEYRIQPQNLSLVYTISRVTNDKK